MPDQIPRDILESPVEGLNLREGTLADQLGDAPTLVVFLRHFGCAFCKEAVSDLRKISADKPGFPPVLFFFLGTIEEGREFFDLYWPEARAVADRPKAFYRAMGLRRATMTQMMGMQVWTCGFRAMIKGHFMGKPVGDPFILPGVFLVHGADVLWCHEFAHQGDNPDWSSIPGKIPELMRS